MSVDFVLLLPLIAIAIGVFFPISIADVQSTYTLRSSRIRVILLRRFSILVLMFSTAAAMIVPFYGMNNLAKGILLSTALLLPAYVAHIWLKVSYKRRHQSPLKLTETETETETETDIKGNSGRQFQRYSSGTEVPETPTQKRAKRQLERATKNDADASIDIVLDEETTS